MHKNAVRAAAIERRKSLGQQRRQAYSHSIMASLFKFLSAQTIKSQCILMYRSLPLEVATEALLQTQAYNLFAPLTQSDASMQWLNFAPTTGWKKGVFGVLEPQSGSAWHRGNGVTTLLCPLTAFDRQGNRLGMGKGCFDMWLSQHRGDIQQVIGLAFACQEIGHVPIEEHDMPMDVVITEQEVIRVDDSTGCKKE